MPASEPVLSRIPEPTQAELLLMSTSVRPSRSSPIELAAVIA